MKLEVGAAAAAGVAAAAAGAAAMAAGAAAVATGAATAAAAVILIPPECTNAIKDNTTGGGGRLTRTREPVAASLDRRTKYRALAEFIVRIGLALRKNYGDGFKK